jgi:hypothetical protein
MEVSGAVVRGHARICNKCTGLYDEIISEELD